MLTHFTTADDIEIVTISAASVAVGVRFISLLVQRAWQTRSLLLTAGLVTAGYGLYFFVKDLPVFVAMLVGKM